MNILPVILSGGAGTRLWPSSRSMYPKQLLSLTGPLTMLQATAQRLDGLEGAADRCVVVCNERHRFSVAEQLAAIEHTAGIILEPAGRNTAPAVALAAEHAVQGGDDPVLLVMPADHVIADVAAFQAAVATAVVAAGDGKLVTFGIVPRSPDTGFGYLRARRSKGAAVPVESFVEKPDLATAEAYLDDGGYFWNSGMFVFRASAFLAALKQHAPLMHSACRRAMADERLDGQFVRPEAEAFAACPADSIDYAVMEKADNVVMVPLDAGWSDVGSWAALHDVLPSDEAGNSKDGDVVMHNCKGTYVQAESRLVGAVGLEDVVVVETKDCVLVANRHQSQNVKEIVERLKADARPETEWHREVFRPWGSFDSLESRDNFQVKVLVVETGRQTVAAKTCASRGTLGRRQGQGAHHTQRRGIRSRRQRVDVHLDRRRAPYCQPV